MSRPHRFRFPDYGRHFLSKALILFIFMGFSSLSQADEQGPVTIDAITASESLKKGYIDVWYEQETGKTWLLVNKNLGEFIYQTSLSHGLGSNDIGLDRGQLGQTRLVELQRVGDKVMLLQKNTAYRAMTDNASEVKAITDSFANAIVWQFPLKEHNDDLWLLDASDFLLRDTHEVVDRLKGRKQGSYRFDKSRSAVVPESYKSFPLNTELEARLTFLGSQPGEYVRQVAIDPKNVSLKIRHSFVKLPEPGYEPLEYHPKSGYFAYSFQDYGKPINEPLSVKWIPRHRLSKKDPNAEVSEAVKPIVYYLDAGVPEPVRSALLDGARWWDQAYQAIGYKNAFQVKVLPPDADPMDVRYNIIQWVHRATRGWSYGASIKDPRTGEIIKGHVSLGSLRIRQDYLIAQAMLAPFAGDAVADDKLQTLAINRIKQLSAHEVGHTLGLAHNFAASTYNRGSVMDYPHPLFLLKDGFISADNAYTEELGIWDKRAIAYAYSHFPEATAAHEREKLLKENHEKGYWFISDADSRGIDDAQPISNLWDNGANAIDELQRVMRLRSVALAKFGEASLRTGRAYSDLEEILVPAYYFHRFQAIAAGKSVGGYDYYYHTKGQDELMNKAVDSKEQQRAIDTLIKTLSPDFLSISDELAELVAPKIHSSYRTRESINGNMGVVFDRFTLAANSAQHTLNILLNDQRLMRLTQQGAVDTSKPRVADLLMQIHRSLLSRLYTGIKAEIQVQLLSQVNSNYLNKLYDDKTPERLKEEYFVALMQIHEELEEFVGRQDVNATLRRHAQYERFRLEKAMASDTWTPIALPKMPPGSPI